MPLGRLLKRVADGNGSKKEIVLSHHCLVMRTGDLWTILDTENNNELVQGVTTRFLRAEIKAQRLIIDAGWDLMLPPDEDITKASIPSSVSVDQTKDGLEFEPNYEKELTVSERVFKSEVPAIFCLPHEKD